VDVGALHLLQAIEGLVHDLGALRHLHGAHPVAVEAGAEGPELALADADLERVVLVPRVGRVLAQVARRPAPAEVGAGQVVRDRDLHRAHPDVGGALDEDLVLEEEIDQLGIRDRLELSQELPAGLDEPLGQVVADSAHPVVVVEKAGPAGPLEHVEDLLPVAQEMQEGREGADVHAVRAHGDAVRGDPLQLGHDHADGLDVRAGLDLEQALDGEGVAQRVPHGGHVVHAVGVGDHARIVDVLRVLLEAAVQVADVGPGRAHDLAVRAQLQAQHAVGGRVLRTHVQDHLVGVEIVDPPAEARHQSSTCLFGGV
jgi:hypothetical protein